MIFDEILMKNPILILAFLLISAGNSNEPISNNEGSENVNEDILREKFKYIFKQKVFVNK